MSDGVNMAIFVFSANDACLAAWKQWPANIHAHATSVPNLAPDLRPLRLAAFIEGTTLLALLGMAVPLKHLAGYPGAVSLMDPIHGAAFLFYFWRGFNALGACDWRRKEMAYRVASAFLPLGALISARCLQRKAAELAARTPTPHGDSAS